MPFSIPSKLVKYSLHILTRIFIISVSQRKTYTYITP
jgi:hypothetical protein